MVKNITPLQDRLAQIDPDDILTHVACGGSLEEYAKATSIRYSDIWRYLMTLPEWEKKYDLALKTAEHRDKDLVLRTLRGVIDTHPTDMFEDDGSLKPVSEWPRELIAGFEVEELESHEKGERGQVIGSVKKVKAVDRLKAVEMLGKERGMFVQRNKVEATLTLEQLVEQSNRIEPRVGDIQQ